MSLSFQVRDSKTVKMLNVISLPERPLVGDKILLQVVGGDVITVEVLDLYWTPGLMGTADAVLRTQLAI